MDQNIAAQHVKSEMMCQLGGRTLQHGSPESKVQSCLDKNFPPPTDTDLVQEAKSRLMAQAGQIHPGSFEAKFQEFADFNYPQGGPWAEPEQVRNTSGRLAPGGPTQQGGVSQKQSQTAPEVHNWRDIGQARTGEHLVHFADVGNLQGGQGYNAAIDNPPEEIRTTSETPEMPREKLKDINASYAVIESDFDDQREQPYRDTSNHPSRTLDYSRTQ